MGQIYLLVDSTHISAVAVPLQQSSTETLKQLQGGPGNTQLIVPAKTPGALLGGMQL